MRQALRQVAVAVEGEWVWLPGQSRSHPLVPPPPLLVLAPARFPRYEAAALLLVHHLPEQLPS